MGCIGSDDAGLKICGIQKNWDRCYFNLLRRQLINVAIILFMKINKYRPYRRKYSWQKYSSVFRIRDNDDGEMTDENQWDFAPVPLWLWSFFLYTRAAEFPLIATHQRILWSDRPMILISFTSNDAVYTIQKSKGFKTCYITKYDIWNQTSQINLADDLFIRRSKR